MRTKKMSRKLSTFHRYIVNVSHFKRWDGQWNDNNYENVNIMINKTRNNKDFSTHNCYCALTYNCCSCDNTNGFTYQTTWN